MVAREKFEDAALVMEMLGSLFSCDPVIDGNASEVFDALASADVEPMAAAWPYVPEESCGPLLERLREGAAGDRESLAKEYRRLFVGPQSLPAPPYGSVYTDPDQVLFGESTLELRSWLDEVGIGVSTDEVVPEDHIGTMLALLGWIMRVKPELAEDYLGKHLLTWSFHYLDQLEDAAGDGFYQALAKLTKLTLAGLQEELDVSVDTPHFYR